MKFKKETLQEIVSDDSDQYEIIKDEIIDTSRWSVHHEVIFQDVITEKYYYTTYSCGSTEQQMEYPYEYGPDEIECPEVEPFEKTVIEYRLRLVK